MRYRLALLFSINSKKIGKFVTGKNHLSGDHMLNRVGGLLLCILFFVGNAAAEGEIKGGGRFLFLPFDSDSAGKYAYLADGIHSMLASRLAAKSGVQLVDYAVHEAELKSLDSAGKNASHVKTVLAKLQADYLVSGALYATESGLKIQIVVSSAASMSDPWNFMNIAESEEQIIPTVGILAEEIAEKVVSPQKPISSAKDVGRDDEGLSGFRTEHPEKQYKKGMYGGGAIVTSEGSDVEVVAKGVKRSSIIPVVAIAMDTGDFDGDGNAEIIFASKTELRVFKYADGRFQKIGGLELRPTYKIHAVNAADLDKDGRDEVYVSANEGFRVASMILRLSATKGGLEVQQDNISWYLRPVYLPGEGMILAGQMADNDPARGFVKAGIYRLEKKQGGKISRGAKFPISQKINLFDFVWVDLDGDKTIETVAIDRNEKLMVFDDTNELIWVSQGNYGGSRNYAGPDRNDTGQNLTGSVAGGQESDRDLSYVPTKLLARDIDGDGKQEIIIGRNKRTSPFFFRNYREYEGGSIVCLDWRESEMKEVWTTNNIQGYITDYSFIQSHGATGNLKAQLYVAQVPGSTFLGFLASKESKMLVYEMELPQVHAK